MNRGEWRWAYSRSWRGDPGGKNVGGVSYTGSVFAPPFSPFAEARKGISVNDERVTRKALSLTRASLKLLPEEVERWLIQRVGERFSQETIPSAAGAWVDDKISSS